MNEPVDNGEDVTHPDDGPSPNPWQTIWTSPLTTMGRIAAYQPMHWFWLLVLVGGTSRMMTSISDIPTDDPVIREHVLPLVLVGGPVSGIALVFGIGRLLHWALLRMGGSGTWVGTRTAMAWALSPCVPGFLLWSVMITSYGSDVLYHGFFDEVTTPYQGAVIGLDYFVLLVLTVWSRVLEVLGLAHMHGLHWWKALLAEVVVGLGLFAVGAAIILSFL